MIFSSQCVLIIQQKKRVESVDLSLTFWYILLTVCTRYVNILYKSVSDKSIENQELIRRVFLLCICLEAASVIAT